MKGGNEGWMDERVGGDSAEEIVLLTNDGSLQTLNVLLLLKRHIVQFCFGCRQEYKRNKNKKISSRSYFDYFHHMYSSPLVMYLPLPKCIKCPES